MGITNNFKNNIKTFVNKIHLKVKIYVPGKYSNIIGSTVKYLINH